MFETIKKLFKEEEGYEIAMEKNDYEKHVDEKSEYLKLKFEEDSNSSDLVLDVYFRGDYIGYVLVDRAKKETLYSEDTTCVLQMVSKIVCYNEVEEKREQQRLRKEIEKEKLKLMRLRNELLKKKLGEEETK